MSHFNKEKRFNELLAKMLHNNKIVAAEPDKGKLIKVVKGRKIPHGTCGIIFWIGVKVYGGKPVVRIGFDTAERVKYFTNASNVVVVAPDRYELSESVIREATMHQVNAEAAREYQSNKLWTPAIADVS
jgi:hypothetical protein